MNETTTIKKTIKKDICPECASCRHNCVYKEAEFTNNMWVLHCSVCGKKSIKMTEGFTREE